MPARQTSTGIPLSHLLPADVEWYGENPSITGLTQDSRLVTPGDLFLAVRGGTHDGRDYLDQAVAAGAAALLVEADGFAADTNNISIPLVLITGLDRQLSTIAGQFYGDPSRTVGLVGVTGTNGKTTCTYLLAQLWAGLGLKAGVLGTLGYGQVKNGHLQLQHTGMTTPDAVQTQRILADLKDDGVSDVAMEVSSHSLDQGRVATLAFDVAVFTNLSRDHLDYHGDLEGYGAAKATLFRMPGLSVAIVNQDDSFGRQLASILPPSAQCISYGLDQTADLWVENLQLGAAGITGTVHTPWGSGELRSPLLGEFNALNLLAVIATACARGHSLADVLAVLPGLVGAPGRMESVNPGGSPCVVVDYAHTPDALENVLAALRQQCDGQLWCVFGCGGDRDKGKRPEMGAIAARLADQVVITSDNPRGEKPAGIINDILSGISASIPEGVTVAVEADRRAAIRHAITLADANDVVLIAGKGHEDYQLVGDLRLAFSDKKEALVALQQCRNDYSAGGQC